MQKTKIIPVITAVLLLLAGCMSANKYHISNAVVPEIIELQYPVVMVHGIARNDTHKMYKPWGRIPAILKMHGVNVYFGYTDAWGDIESNAELLKATIDRVLLETQKPKVNIIAHSKGGLDSRYMIWNYNYGNKVASLTTIASPHNGSEIADLLYDRDTLFTKWLKKRIKFYAKVFKDHNPDVFMVTYQLTTHHMEEFNEKVTLSDNVYFQCFYSIMDDPYHHPRFTISCKYLDKLTGANDGVVSEKSAKFTPCSTRIPGSLSHEQIIDQQHRKDLRMIIPNIYLEIVNELAIMGF